MADMLGNFTTAGNTGGTIEYNGTWYPWREWWDIYQPPQTMFYTTSNVVDDKPGTAFKVLKALMAAKMIEVKTARKFVDLMEEIIKAL